MKDYYQKLKDAILQDVNAKLSQPLEEKAAERIKKDLDIATECQDFIDANDEDALELPEEIMKQIDEYEEARKNEQEI